MTQHLLAAWPEIAPRLRRADRLAFFTDFDGTLAPIRRDAGAVQLAKSVRHTLSRLACRGAVIGVVSGRALEDVRMRVGVRDIWYAGDHGFVIRGPHSPTVRLVTRAQQSRINAVTRQLRGALRHIQGVIVESKGATVAVHYRQVPAHSHHQAAEIVQRILDQHERLRLIHGKKVWEVLPAGLVDKSAAIRRILRLERRRLGTVRLPIYMGDDVADEHVFAAWRGLSIAVGHQPHTAAQYYLRSCAEVQQFLRKLEQI